jgi:hypothetical protein
MRRIMFTALILISLMSYAQDSIMLVVGFDRIDTMYNVNGFGVDYDYALFVAFNYKPKNMYLSIIFFKNNKALKVFKYLGTQFYSVYFNSLMYFYEDQIKYAQCKTSSTEDFQADSIYFIEDYYALLDVDDFVLYTEEEFDTYLKLKYRKE